MKIKLSFFKRKIIFSFFWVFSQFCSHIRWYCDISLFKIFIVLLKPLFNENIQIRERLQQTGNEDWFSFISFDCFLFIEKISLNCIINPWFWKLSIRKLFAKAVAKMQELIRSFTILFCLLWLLLLKRDTIFFWWIFFS